MVGIQIFFWVLRSVSALETLGLDINFWPVGIQYFGAEMGYGAVAKQDIEKGTPSMIIPIDLVINSADPFPLSPYLNHLASEALLAYRLLWDRFSESPAKQFSKKWTEILPKEYNVLSIWNTTERSWMDEYSLKFLEYNHSFKPYEEFLKAKSSIEKLDWVPQELLDYRWFQWGYAAVLSRTWSYPAAYIKQARGEEVKPEDFAIRTTGMYPVAENVNHCTVPSKHRKPSIQLSMTMKDKWAAVMAQTNFKKGQEFCIEYDEDPNNGMLFKYGFVVEKNYLEEFFIEKKTKNCNEKVIEGGICQWALKSYELNPRLLEYLSKGKGKEEGLKSYISEVKNILKNSKYSIRELRRKNSAAEMLREKFAITYGVGQRLLLQEHVKFAMRDLLKNYSEKLKLIN
ncbi:unnamed protein product [Blepharisma stoltei]|uniref:SET domain-containing protein n=1 Tax=Blepharisma stoltei TaxID=1481888 RepID=A0AAU9IY34_9CILI|nr:unnamed protein product [Blepharisma stoltei]